MDCCVICFSPVPLKSLQLSCSDPMCTSIICLECGDALLKFSLLEKEIPKCPSTSCRQHYMHSQIKQLGPESTTIYNNLCYDHFMTESKEELDNKANHKVMIQNIRKEKVEFIDDHFPVAIALTIKYALSSKLKTINSSSRTQIRNTLDQMNRKCMNMCCPGKLDDMTNTCVVCNTIFCEHCECPKSMTSPHVCTQENIDSVQFVKTLTKCPNPSCRLPVIRSWGCNYITCSVCKTNFDYTTGKKTIDGNHQHIHTFLNTTTKALDRFGHDSLDNTLLGHVDQLVPNTPSLTRILSALSKVYKNSIHAKNTSMQIAKEYELYKSSQYAYKAYYRALVIIEEHHVKKTLTNEVLKNIIEKLKKL